MVFRILGIPTLGKEEKVNEPTELDLAQLRHDMREMYKNLGFEGSLQVFYEMLKGAEVLAEVIIEERQKGDN